MNGERSYTRLGAPVGELDQACEERIQDANVLRQEERWATAIAMLLYALEIRLKERICRRLELNQLPKAFEIHEMGGLLVLSGLSSRLDDAETRQVKMNWNLVKELANELNGLRYKPDPARWSKAAAEDVFRWINDEPEGILPWISHQN
jgi:hypothetical protein